MRFIMRSSVDLPQPDGPMKAVTLVAQSGTDVLQRRIAVVERQIVIETLTV